MKTAPRHARPYSRYAELHTGTSMPRHLAHVRPEPAQKPRSLTPGYL